MAAKTKNTTCERCSREWLPKSSHETCPFCRVESLENTLDTFLPRLTQVTARHRHGIPIPEKFMNVLANAQLDLEDALTLKERFTHPEFLISACYYPGLGEVEVTWENQEGGHFGKTFRINRAEGKKLANLIMPCVMQTAAIDLKKLVRV